MTRFLRIAVAASATLATIVAATPSTTAAIVHHPRHGQGTGVGNLGLSSSNWSGYAVTGAGFTAVTGSWSVQSVSATKKASYSSQWIGIDGFNNSSLIQTGTESDYVQGAARYAAWWEILPAAAAVASHFGIGLPEIARGIRDLASVPGRLERVDAGQPFPVFVDYAHTEDALSNCLSSLRPLTSGRIICVFGAGCDRDKLKRPLLGRAAAEADLPVVTSDNPRSEAPQSIVNDILAGFAGSRRQPYVDVDRERAIRWAIQHAGPGDTVLIAGKGH